MDIFKSNEIKRMIYKIVTENKLSIRRLCDESGVDFVSFKNYLAGLSNSGIAESDFISFLNLINIRLRYTIVVSPLKDMSLYVDENYNDVLESMVREKKLSEFFNDEEDFGKED